jgi:cell wall assembly regulator SMI1
LLIVELVSVKPPKVAHRPMLQQRQVRDPRRSTSCRETLRDGRPLVATSTLKIASEPDEALVPAQLLPDVPVERSFDAFVQSACLRDREEIETACRRLEDKLWNDWRAFKDVSGLREQVRALRWLLGAALHWRDVPVYVARHELPPPHAASRALLSRLDHAWKKLRKKFRQPLPGPLSEEEVDDAEREIGHRFPADLRASFLRHGAESYPPIELLSLDSALEQWRMLDTWTMRADEPVWANEPDHRPSFASTDDSLRSLKGGGWRRAWFPITSAELDSDFHGADLDPAPGGVAGQVFYWSHELPGPVHHGAELC